MQTGHAVPAAQSSNEMHALGADSLIWYVELAQYVSAGKNPERLPQTSVLHLRIDLDAV